MKRATVLWCALALTALCWAVLPYRLVVVIGPSMHPTLSDGQVVLSKRVDRRILKGDIVVCVADGSRVVKRVAFLPGEIVEPWDDGDGSRPCIVPAGHVWLLGDNRGASTDSRTFGAVPLESIEEILL